MKGRLVTDDPGLEECVGTRVLDEFAGMVKEVTGGELEIKVNSGGALGLNGPELLKVVRDGLVPLSGMLVSGVAGEDKAFHFVNMTYVNCASHGGRKGLGQLKWLVRYGF